MPKRSPQPKNDKMEPGPVGPGHPPLEHRFRKGMSGNPKGRPKKERSLRKLVEAELDQFAWITQNGKRVRLTLREVVAKTVVKDAAKGDDKALDRLIKLIGGGSEPENPVVQVDPAELARFALRYLPRQPEETKAAVDPNNDHDDGQDGEDQA